MRIEAEKADLLVLCTHGACHRAGQLEMARLVPGLEKPCVLVALDAPIDISGLPKFRTAIASFGFRGPAVQALASVLAGESQAGGIMPIDV